MTGAMLAAPTAVIKRDPRRAPASASVPSDRTLGDDARLVVTLAVGATLVFLPAAALVVGELSGTFVRFALVLSAEWLLSIGLQVLAVRWQNRRPWPVPRLMQLAATSIIGVSLHIGLGPLTNRYSVPLGLDAGDGWESVVGAWTSVLIGVFVVWQREARSRQAGAARRLFDVQQAQLRLRQRLVDSQLLAVQARVEPTLFFGTLDRVEALYREDKGRAEALLDELVVFLRAALPSLDDASSILAREIDLTASCVHLHALATGRESTLTIDIEPGLRRLPCPAGVLLPLMRGLLDGAPASGGLTISARLGSEGDDDDRSIHLRIVAPVPAPGPMQAATAAAAETLHLRYGDAAALAVGAAGDGRVRVDIAMPREP